MLDTLSNKSNKLWGFFLQGHVNKAVFFILNTSESFYFSVISLPTLLFIVGSKSRMFAYGI